jgi:hypothetical protein
MRKGSRFYTRHIIAMKHRQRSKFQVSNNKIQKGIKIRSKTTTKQEAFRQGKNASLTFKLVFVLFTHRSG